MIEKLKIMGIDYSVVELPMLEYLGLVRECNAIIIVSHDMCQDFKVNVIMHEAIHTILTLCGQDLEGTAEPLVIALGNGIIQLIKDNPEFVKWINTPDDSNDYSFQLRNLGKQINSGANNDPQS